MGDAIALCLARSGGAKVHSGPDSQSCTLECMSLDINRTFLENKS